MPMEPANHHLNMDLNIFIWHCQLSDYVVVETESFTSQNKQKATFEKGVDLLQWRGQVRLNGFTGVAIQGGA